MAVEIIFCLILVRCLKLEPKTFSKSYDNNSASQDRRIATLVLNRYSNSCQIVFSRTGWLLTHYKTLRLTQNLRGDITWKSTVNTSTLIY